MVLCNVESSESKHAYSICGYGLYEGEWSVIDVGYVAPFSDRVFVSELHHPPQYRKGFGDNND